MGSTPAPPALEGLSAAVAAACGLETQREPPSGIDWAHFDRLVERHRVASLVHRSGWLEIAGSPAGTREAVTARARRDALRSLHMLAVQRKVLDALGEAGIDAIVLKGLALAAGAYGELTARPPGDLDLVVDPSNVLRTVRVLTEAGFDWYGLGEPEASGREPIGADALSQASSLPLLRHVTLTSNGVYVEVHWRLFENDALMRVDPAWLTAPRYVHIQETRIPTLPPVAEWFYVLVHGSVHLWSRMKWLADVPVIASRRPDLLHVSVLEQAARAGYAIPIAAGLIVAEAAFGPFLTPQSRGWAASVKGASGHARRSLRALSHDESQPREYPLRALPGHIAARLSLRKDAAYRLSELRLLLLEAGRTHGVANPGLARVAAGPFSLTGRRVRRARRVHPRR